MDTVKKIDAYLEQDKLDEGMVDDIKQIVIQINDISTKMSSRKARLDAIEKLKDTIKSSNLKQNVKDAFLRGVLLGFKEGARA